MHLIEGLLANDCDIQPSTVHADTQGQSVPVFTLATLFGFDLMPRIRNFADLIFFRASAHLIYPHIDELFGERGRNVIDWQLIERHGRDGPRIRRQPRPLHPRLTRRPHPLAGQARPPPQTLTNHG